MLTILITIFTSTYTLAYEPKYLNTDNSNTHRLIGLVTDKMQFKSSSRGMELRQEKNKLAMCVLDHLVSDALEFEVDIAATIAAEAFDLSQYYEADYWGRGYGLSKEDTEYFNELDYACIEYHWDPESVTKRYIIITQQDEIRKDCAGDDWVCQQNIVDSIYNQMQGEKSLPELDSEPEEPKSQQKFDTQIEDNNELGLQHLDDQGAINWIIGVTTKYEGIDILKNYTHESVRMYFFCHLEMLDFAFDDRSEFIRAIAELDTWYDNYKSYGNLNLLSKDNREGFEFLKNHCIPKLEL